MLAGAGACGDDNGASPVEPVTPPSPGLEVPTDVLRVKNGEALTLQVTQGGGDYNVFSLDPSVATATIVDGQIEIQGVEVGQTAIIVSDSGGYYRKVPVSVYVYETITIDKTEIDLVALLGNVAFASAQVTQGNGGYSIASSDTRVTAMIADDGSIAMSATSKPDDYTATLTVTDKSGLTATILVTVKASYEPFTEEDLADIKADATRTYILDGYQSNYMGYGKSVNADNGDGTISYGWQYAPISWLTYRFKITFTGDKTVGKKTDALLDYTMYMGDTYNVPIDLEIIQADATNIWGVFTFVLDEAIHYGYFRDTL